MQRTNASVKFRTHEDFDIKLFELQIVSSTELFLAIAIKAARNIRVHMMSFSYCRTRLGRNNNMLLRHSLCIE